MKTVIFLIAFFSLSCDRSMINSDPSILGFSESITIERSGKSYEIKFLEVKDNRCEINPAFSVHGTLPAEISLEIIERNCTGIACSKTITLSNYECGKNGKTNLEEIFTEKSKTIDGYSAEALGLEIGLLQVSPTPVFDPVKREYLQENKTKYKATIIIR